MLSSTMRFQVLIAFAAFLSTTLCNAQSIASFYSTKGPIVVSLDALSGNFSYNVYTAKGFSSMKSFSPTVPAKKGTSIACVGYNSNTTVYGAIFYQTPNNTLAEQFFKCLYNSGNCVNYGGWLVSANVTTPVKPGTGLAVSLLSTNFGYRLTYEDIYGSVRQLSYSSTTKGDVTPWADGALTTNVTVGDAPALATTFTISPNDTIPAQQVIYQVSDDGILSFVDSNTTFINATDTWVEAPTITNLPNWSKNNTFSVALYNNWTMLFYIDTTRQLQYIRSVDKGQTWAAQPLQEAAVQPLADIPNAPVTASASINTSDNSISVFYFSGGRMIQSVMTDYTWGNPYTIVDAVVPSNITIPTNPPAPIQPAPKNTKTVKIAASTAASASFLIIVAIVAWCMLRKTKVVPNVESHGNSDWKGSESDFSGKPELDGHALYIHELDHDPECMLLHQLQLIRMYEMRGEIPVEIEGCEVGRFELDHTLCKCEMDAAVLCELPTWVEKDDEKGKKEETEGECTTGCSENDKGKEKENVGEEAKELPTWSWDILKREKGDLGPEVEAGGKQLRLEIVDGREMKAEKDIVSPL